MVMGRGFVRRRPLARAAVVGGTFAAGRAMGKRAEQKQDAESSQAAKPADTAGSGGSSGSPPMLDQLAKLTKLHDQGALTDEEFASAKAQVLGG